MTKTANRPSPKTSAKKTAIAKKPAAKKATAVKSPTAKYAPKYVPKKPLSPKPVAVPTKAPKKSATKPSAAAKLRERLQLKQPEFAQVLAVSPRTVATLDKGEPGTEAVSRRLTELERLTKALGEVMQSESIGPWLKAPNTAFDGLKPLEVIERGQTDRLWEMIYFLRSGVGS